MPHKDTLLIRNGRIYTPDAVIIDQAIYAKRQTVTQVTNERQIVVESDAQVINAGNVIVAPGFINACIDADSAQDSTSLVSRLRRLKWKTLDSGTTALCLMVSAAKAKEVMDRICESNFINDNNALRILGFRLNCSQMAHANGDYHFLENLLGEFAKYKYKLLEIRADESQPELISYLLELRKLECFKVCVQINSPDGLKETYASDVDCLSVPTSMISEMDKISGWIEWRLPTSIDFSKKRAATFNKIYKRLIVGNYWSPSNSSASVDGIGEFKYKMYYSNQDGFEFMAPNQAVRYLSAHLGLPLNWAIRICTYNICTYLGLDNLGAIKVGNPLNVVICDSKVKIRKVLT
jgi:hypothetical protein